jgi:glucose/arabinose dehydrogenase
MFVVRKGSWNRDRPFGFDVINVRATPDGKNVTVTSFMTGFQDPKERGYKFWGRPAYVLQMPDGALLVSDEQLGAIYRVSYAGARSASTK